ncbi:hypothetical protein [Pseudoroseomonas cervicalis]|uniref:hypothetical protein n=1 Tax=Teichococcus cervicalis TaxID=204525 RepID=UPI0022F17FB3|nr:hypothetical protein [Pseudoroseomonas cervicalis]WBV41539.1 hypothetical protein PFY06_09780 [Pseudoroseomonas cervicalis]
MTAYKDARALKEAAVYSSPEGASYDEAATSRKLRSAIKLLAMFCIAYFVAAMIATPEFKHIAQIELMGLPLGFYTGILVFFVGIVVTRMCLNQDQRG